MSKKTELESLMDVWEAKHRQKGYKRFIRDGLVYQEAWESQQTPKVCYFLKEAYTSDENGYHLTESLHKADHPWTMWRKIAIWTQAIYQAFSGNFCEYDEELLRSREKETIDRIAVVNVKKSNGENGSDYEDLKAYAEEDKAELKQELEIIRPDIIVCGNNLSLLKIVLGEELQNEYTWDTMFAWWNDTLVIDYYHPAVHYPNRVNYYALMSICDVARKARKIAKDIQEKQGKAARIMRQLFLFVSQ